MNALAALAVQAAALGLVRRGTRGVLAGLTLSAGTVTASTPPLDATQTWNAAGVTFTALKLNVTDTASAAASLFLDLHKDGVSQFSVGKTGLVTSTNDIRSGASLRASSNSWVFWAGRSILTSPADGNVLLQNQAQTAFGLLQFGGTTASFPALKRVSAELQTRLADDSAYAGLAAQYYSLQGDITLARDGADVLAQRRGANAQTFRLYNTFTDASNYERVNLTAAATVLGVANSGLLNTQSAGTGTTKPLGFGAGNAIHWAINTSGHFLAATDNTYDIGQTGATRPRNIFAGSNVTAGNGSLVGNQDRGGFYMTADGVMVLRNNANNNFGRLNFGGETASFPALKRSTTFLHVRLADDSDFAPLVAMDLYLRAPGSALSFGSADDVVIRRDAANVLAQRNGVNAQSYHVYNTFTDASNYERALIGWSSNILVIGTRHAGTGTARSMEFQTSNTSRWSISSSGHFLAAADNTYDIGASGANRPRNVFIANDLTMVNGILNAGSGWLQLAERSDPNAPSADLCRVYARDNGSGKTQLVVRFNTGAVQVIAEEP